MEVANPFYLLWPIALLIDGKFALLGANIFFFQSLVALPALLLMGSLVMLLYASAARRQISLTGLVLGALGAILLPLVLMGQYSFLLSSPFWWLFQLGGPIALIIWAKTKRRMANTPEVSAMLIVVGSALTYMVTLPYVLGFVVR